ncbi:hypothetical protein MKK58_08675 [Methylobacterium sp. J-078]|nr:hypothetical protein [Methylobacterium sp. J-078]MCJ2044602.1 hypothetical protein [Methylobacterium sp. J-078]
MGRSLMLGTVTNERGAERFAAKLSNLQLPHAVRDEEAVMIRLPFTS